MENLSEASGVIGETTENGLPVIWSFVNELPSEAERASLSWLIVIAWQYDGSARNGMPSEQVNQDMLKLEDALEQLEVPGKHVPVYRRTGNGLKEFAFHARGTDEFMHSLNVSLASHSPYPIEIKFYEDGEWSDFRRLLADFDPTQQAIQPDRAKTQLR